MSDPFNPVCPSARRRCPVPLLGAAVAALLILVGGPVRAQNNNNNNNRSNGTNNANRTNTTASTGNTANRSTTNSSSNNSASETRQYRNNTQLGDALIQIDPETRSLVIVADEKTHNEILKVIKNLDRPKPQVLIKVLFAQVTLDNSTDIGVEGGYAFNTGQPVIPQLLTSAAQAATGIVSGSTPPTTTTTTNNVVTNPNGSTTTNTSTTAQPAVIGNNGLGIAQTNFGAAAQTTGAFFRLNTNNATATLYALQQKGKVSVLSRPSILARNNQEAVIVVGQEVPIPTTNQSTEAGQTINSVSYQDVGIILRVTPFITANKTVEMIVSPEISSLSTQTVAISSNFNAPIINKTSAETVVVTPDATTVVIGGLMQKQQSSNVTKVPLLGDIPYLGNAFKRTTKSETKNELLIFLTPYIVEGTDNMEASAVDQLNRTDLPQETLDRKEVQQFLDDNIRMDVPVARPVPSPAATTTTTTRRTTTRTRSTPK